MSSSEGQGLQRLQRENRVKKEAEKQLVSWLPLLGDLWIICVRDLERREITEKKEKKKLWKGRD
jgi:hypothetical protein